MSAEIISTQMTADEARRITERIRLKFTSAAQALDSLGALAKEAYDRRADLALGYPSWQEYADGEFAEQTLGLAPAIRRELVARLTESGMSQRAIAPTLGVTRQAVQQIQQTVVRDVARNLATSERIETGGESPHVATERIDLTTGEVMTEDEFIARSAEVSDEDFEARSPRPARSGEMSRDAVAAHFPTQPPKVTGLDGKTYSRPEPKATKRSPLTDAFWRATVDITKRVESITRLTEDDRFRSNAEKVALANRSDLIRARDALDRVIEQLPERN